MQKEILSTNEAGNFFFGFHDTLAWNDNGTRLAALKIKHINIPPSLDNPCSFGFIDDEQRFHEIGITYAYNYPQGARQQWLHASNNLIINDKVAVTWGSKVYDTDEGKLISELPYPCHVITKEGWAFGLDYARLHRVGGYGYTGIKDKTEGQNAPDTIGITKHNIYTNENSLLVSIKEVANFEMSENIGVHHYITHLVLNPLQDRIAFLHRFKLKDGGETTRLMTIGSDGNNLRCLATGFLSHFDWKDNSTILIWGRIGSNVEKLRNSKLYSLLPKELIFYAKKALKLIYYSSNNSFVKSDFNWMLFSDDDTSKQDFFAKDIMVVDGHPMFCPTNRDWLICDTYPNEAGIRELFLFQESTQKRILLGQYKMIDSKPNIEDAKPTLTDVEPSVLKSFSIEMMAFYRSGLHCDLHPRWKPDGSTVAFDSIHSGERKIYSFDVRNYLQ
ncbi:TolB-like translocation protein [Solitalea canadensis]|uniref:Periplasmic component of the Tol biopolymer transport system n=1 Tax=Solitalea canadensis (strain ATCC 29591 / DSM 3403 / JCM 21819 / LMG 8368 / NBRC 15130 / NCIMB 12057 / USAM 9D) TaxID=929556 RepID=H8KSA0_SOLCM|nr:hypothetical protein [Solitalea canadensis]AFD08008.1 hypothetical protein Solca_2989 [Solitalea canadensis DSM 3403]